MVVGVVVRRVGVLPRADLGQDLLVLFGRPGLRAPKHHVLEEVREPGLARLDLVARSRLHGDLERDDVGEAGRHDDDLQAVGESLLRRPKGKNVRCRNSGPVRFRSGGFGGGRLLGHGNHRNKGQKNSGKGRNAAHEFSSFCLGQRLYPHEGTGEPRLGPPGPAAQPLIPHHLTFVHGLMAATVSFCSACRALFRERSSASWLHPTSRRVSPNVNPNRFLRSQRLGPVRRRSRAGS